MMGTKQRSFAPLVQLSLEELVPRDHFYRHVERTLDLSFVREFVQQTYAHGGRPGIDPIVFFKLQLVMFFEGIRSERQLMRHAADRLSIRWYVGYDLAEPLPDHSSLTRIRERYGLEVFRCFFDAIVEQCQQEKLIWGKELYIDSTQVNANADVDSLTPRFAVEAREAMRTHLAALFAEEESHQEPQTGATEVLVASPKDTLTEDMMGVMPPPLPIPLYRAPASICNDCPVKVQCTTSHQGRRVYRHVGEEYLERVRTYQQTFAYQKALRKRKVWVEPLFAEAKDWHGMRRCRLRELWRVNCEALMRAAGQNLKRLLKKCGWGRRPFPTEAFCASFLADFGWFTRRVLEDCAFFLPLSSSYSIM